MKLQDVSTNSALREFAALIVAGYNQAKSAYADYGSVPEGGLRSQARDYERRAEFVDTP